MSISCVSSTQHARYIGQHSHNIVLQHRQTQSLLILLMFCMRCLGCTDQIVSLWAVLCVDSPV